MRSLIPKDCPAWPRARDVALKGLVVVRIFLAKKIGTVSRAALYLAHRTECQLRTGTKKQRSAVVIIKCDVACFLAPCDRRIFQCLVGKFVNESGNLGLIGCAVVFHGTPPFVASNRIYGDKNGF